MAKKKSHTPPLPQPRDQFLSWESGLTQALADLGPVRLQVTAIGYEREACDVITETLGAKREALWTDIVSKGSIRTRVARLLEAGFTADEIEYLGLCNLSTGGERTFGHYSSADQFNAEFNRLRRAEREFNSLPGWVRARFGHDVGQLVAFICDPLNEAESMALGLEREVERYLRPNERFDPARGNANHIDLAEERQANLRKIELHRLDTADAAQRTGANPSYSAIEEATARREQREANNKRQRRRVADAS